MCGGGVKYGIRGGGSVGAFAQDCAMCVVLC